MHDRQSKEPSLSPTSQLAAIPSFPEVAAETPRASRIRQERSLHAATRAFARESRALSWWHVLSTFTLLAGALGAAALLPWWPLRTAAAVVGALTLVRAFSMYHDYLHGAILTRSRLARALFYAFGAIVLVPPRSWRASHNAHHAAVGRIAESDVGSFPLMTVETWRTATKGQRFAYRTVRHPVTLLCSYVTVFFLNICLLPLLRRPSVHWDSALVLLGHGAVLAGLLWFGGFPAAFFALLLPMGMAGALGGYMFYAQHNYADLRVLPVPEWTRDAAGLESSSHLKLSQPMRWFTGNLGVHHVHHVNPLIPFYRLPEAMAGVRGLRDPGVTTLRPRDVVACLRANLWDEASGRMVRYRDVPV